MLVMTTMKQCYLSKIRNLKDLIVDIQVAYLKHYKKYDSMFKDIRNRKFPFPSNHI